MAVAYNPGVVSNGLVLALDAGNSKSYDSRENLLTYSEQFDNANWSRGSVSVTANTTATIAPDGNVSADKIVEDSTSNQHLVYQNIGTVTVGSIYTLSCWAKAAERTQISLTAHGEGYSVFNLSSGTVVSTGGNSNVNITAYSNGWYRCSATFTRTNTTGNFYIILWNGTNVYLGDGSSGAYFWGAQLERGSIATTYALTTVSSITRSTTWNDLSGNGNTAVGVGTFVPLYDNSNVGSLVFDGVNDYVEITNSNGFGTASLTPNITLEMWANITRRSGGGTVYQQLAGFRNDTNFNFFILLLDSSGASVNTEARITTASATYDINVNYTSYFGKWTHIVFTATTNRTDLYFNGTLVGSNTNVAGSFGSTSGNFRVGLSPGGVWPTLGNISSVKVYKRGLTASEIQQNFNALRGRFGV